MKCEVKNCGNSSEKNLHGVSFHRFPRNLERRELWIKRLKLSANSVSNEKAVCSVHFRSEDIKVLVNRSKIKRHLDPDALPIELNQKDVSNRADNNLNIVELNVHQGAGNENDLSSNSAIRAGSSSLLGGCDLESINMNLDMAEPRYCQVGETESDPLGDFVMQTVLSKPVISERLSVLHDGCKVDSIDMSLDIAELNYTQRTQRHKKVEVPIGKTQSIHKSATITNSKLNVKMERLMIRVQKLTKENNKLKSQVVRRDQTIKKLKKKQCSLPSECQQCQSSCLINMDSLKGTIRVIIQRIVEKQGKMFYNGEYDEVLKRFAMELYFISPKAYKFLRSEFGDALPCQRTLEKWLQVIDCQPGFSDEALSAVKDNVSKEDNIVWCQLVFDEIYIHSHIDIVGNRVYGFPFLGDSSTVNDTTTENNIGDANQILVFMLVRIDMAWKVPIGYFPMRNMDAEQKTKLVMQAISLSEEAGVQILGITFDGAKVNFSTADLLHVSLKMKLTDYSISKVINGIPRQIFVYPDPCHMIKCVRNTFKKRVLVDSDGGEIKFCFLERLHEFQKARGPKGHVNENKLSDEHINFDHDAMNVALAVQVLSRSVADAIDICRDVLHLKEFEGSEATSNFLRICNDSFDVLNTGIVDQKTSTFSLSTSEFLHKVCVFGESYFAKKINCLGRPKFLEQFKEDDYLNYMQKSLLGYANQENISHFLENVAHHKVLVKTSARIFLERRIRVELTWINKKISMRRKRSRINHFEGC